MKFKANLIPYYIAKDKKIWFYLSRRSKTAKMFPDYFSFWGGGIEEGETAKQAMLREVYEELNLKPENYVYLRDYTTPGCIKSIFYVKMAKKFVDKLPIQEGQYGQWFNMEMVLQEQKLIHDDKMILQDIYQKVEKN